jgi:hypothetical protein
MLAENLRSQIYDICHGIPNDTRKQPIESNIRYAIGLVHAAIARLFRISNPMATAIV